MNKEEFAKLSWKLLEAKILYYLFPLRENISDIEYDKLEKEYLQYCNETDTLNTIQSMVGVDKERPSVQLVICKILRNNL